MMMTTPIAMRRLLVKKVYPTYRWILGRLFLNPLWNWKGMAALQTAAGNTCVKWTAVWPTYLRTISIGTRLSFDRLSIVVTVWSWNFVRPCHMEPGAIKIQPTIIIQSAVSAWYNRTNNNHRRRRRRCCWVCWG